MVSIRADWESSQYPLSMNTYYLLEWRWWRGWRGRWPHPNIASHISQLSMQGKETRTGCGLEVGGNDVARAVHLPIAHADAPERLDAVDVGVQRDGDVAAGDVHLVGRRRERGPGGRRGRRGRRQRGQRRKGGRWFWRWCPRADCQWTEPVGSFARGGCGKVGLGVDQRPAVGGRTLYDTLERPLVGSRSLRSLAVLSS